MQQINQNPNDLKSVLMAMQEGQQQMFSQLREVMTQNNQQPSQMDQMTALLNQMALMKQVMGEPPKPQDPMKTIELAKSLAELMGDGGDKSSLDRLIEQALPALIDGAKQAPQQMDVMAGNTMMRQSNPISVPIPASQQAINKDIQPENVQSEKEENPKMLMYGLMKSKLPELINLAVRDKDPEFYAEFVLDNVPDMFIDKYCDFVSNENCLQELNKLNPEVNNHISWFTQFRNATIEMIKEAEVDNKTAEDLTKQTTIDHDSEHVSESDKGKGETANPDNSDI